MSEETRTFGLDAFGTLIPHGDLIWGGSRFLRQARHATCELLFPGERNEGRVWFYRRIHDVIVDAGVQACFERAGLSTAAPGPGRQVRPVYLESELLEADGDLDQLNPSDVDSSVEDCDSGMTLKFIDEDEVTWMETAFEGDFWIELNVAPEKREFGYGSGGLVPSEELGWIGRDAVPQLIEYLAGTYYRGNRLVARLALANFLWELNTARGLELWGERGESNASRETLPRDGDNVVNRAESRDQNVAQIRSLLEGGCALGMRFTVALDLERADADEDDRIEEQV